MDPFDEREKGFEAKYHFDEEMAFKVSARRAKLLGLWVAGQLGLTGDAAEAYAKTALDGFVGEKNQDAMVNRLLADLSARNALVGAAELHAEMERLFGVARAQIFEETGQTAPAINP